MSAKQPAVLALSGDFSVSLWVEVPVDRAGATGELASRFDPIARRGFTLAAISSAGGYNGPGDELRVSFGIDDRSAPEWVDRGRPSATSNYVSNSLTVYEGQLYAATSDAPEEADRGHVYRFLGGTEWEDCGKVTSEGASGIGPLIVHDGALYAAAWNYDWTRVLEQQLNACHVYRFVAPGRWEDCGQPGNSKRIFGMGTYRGVLYTTGDDFTVHAYRGGTTWEKVGAFPTYGHPLTIGDGRLYAGTLDPSMVFDYDGSTWRDLGNPLGGPDRCRQVHSFAWYRDQLHVGTWPLARVARRDAQPEKWSDIGRLGDAIEINALTVFNGKLYGGTIPRAEVFRYEQGLAWTPIHQFFAPPGWRPVLVRDMETPPDGDRRMREWTRVTSLTEHDGQLFASIGSCTSAAVDAPPDVRGTVHAMTAGTTVTTPRSLEAGWHHLAAVRSGGRLTLFIDGAEAASRTGTVTSSLESAAPLELGRGAHGTFPGGVRGFQAWPHEIEARRIEQLAKEPAPETESVV